MFRKKLIPPPKPQEYPELDYEDKPIENPDLEINKPKESKTPILSPLAIITWILLLGSIFVMAVVMNMGMNMVVTMGYIFLSFGAMCAGFLFLIAMKTPGLIFLKAFLYGKTIAEVRTKDGRIEFILGQYAQGSVKSKKFGSFYVNPDAVKNESKSGKGIIHLVDSIGKALT